MAGVELALHVEPRAVQQRQQAREEHQDAAAQLAAARARQPPQQLVADAQHRQLRVRRSAPKVVHLRSRRAA